MPAGKAECLRRQRAGQGPPPNG